MNTHTISNNEATNNNFLERLLHQLKIKYVGKDFFIMNTSFILKVLFFYSHLFIHKEFSRDCHILVEDLRASLG